jgi:hypothetical protein
MAPPVPAPKGVPWALLWQRPGHKFRSFLAPFGAGSRAHAGFRTFRVLVSARRAGLAGHVARLWTMRTSVACLAP